MIIYKWQHKENGKCYIGQTIQGANQRRLEHLSEARHSPTTYCFHNALRKYGEEAFTYEVIEECNSLEELNEREVYWMDYYNSIDEGYNLRRAGEAKIHSEISKKKMSEAQKAAHARRRAEGKDTFKKTRKTKGWKYKMSAEVKAKWPYCICCRRQMSIGVLANHTKKSNAL
jgi:group I intron endonuclease